MYIVTGGAGFIGSNIVHALNQRGIKDVLVVDDLSDGHKFRNIVDADILDYRDKDEFLAELLAHKYDPKKIKAILHQGACSSTTEWDGRMMMQNNYDYTKTLFNYCVQNRIPLIYASSAAVYGASEEFTVDPANESPLNVYGYSKCQFDRYLRKNQPDNASQVVGLRYFNVYGPREQHKGSMASVAYHFNKQLLDTGQLNLFAGSENFSRDFVFIDDVVAVILWFVDHSQHSGIFNVGTGRSQPFIDVANAVLKWHGRGEINFIPFPAHLQGSYQAFTQAEMSWRDELGYDRAFADVATGVKKYLDWLNK
ncbi:MAG: ADP-glyceromanno-heptose 6-epimerase [Pseudomonadota bacterium]|nr:ADP-glyceromanno-heptose 6-epimerase [Pseudomonadota bacterium]